MAARTPYSVLRTKTPTPGTECVAVRTSSPVRSPQYLAFGTRPDLQHVVHLPSAEDFVVRLRAHCLGMERSGLTHTRRLGAQSEVL